MSQMLIYQNDKGDIKVDVRFEDNSIWLSQSQLCELFGKAKSTISEHIANIFKEGELDQNATVRNFRTVQIEGTREVSREVEYYNLDMIIAVGFRVKSAQGTKDFELIKIGSFLKRNKTQIIVDDSTTYKRVTIKLYNGGVFLRDIELGKNIGTKKQFIIKEGQFLLSKIDARNGAFGVVNNEVDGAIITGNFCTFDADYPQYKHHI